MRSPQLFGGSTSWIAETFQVIVRTAERLTTTEGTAGLVVSVLADEGMARPGPDLEMHPGRREP